MMQPSSKIGRNDPCPCGSKAKFKHCCGKSESASGPASSTETLGLPDIEAAYAHLSAGRLREAETLFRRMLDITPDEPDILHVCGLIACRTGRYDEAAGLIQKATSLDPANPAYWFNLGIAYQTGGKLDQAVPCYRKAIMLNPRDADSHANLGLALQGLGQLQECVASYRAALSIRSNLAEVHNNLGNALKALGRLEEALTSFGNALSLRPEYASAYNNLGNTLRELGRTEHAVVCYRRALALAPTAETLNALGEVLRDQSKPEEAEAVFRQAIARFPNFSAAFSNLGIMLAAQDRFDEAIDCFNRVVAFSPHDANACYNLANALKDQGKTEEAAEAYRGALSLDPHHTDALNNLGNVLKDLGEMEQAIRCYRESLAARPEYLNAYGNLIYAMYFDPERPADEFRPVQHLLEAQLRASKDTWPAHANVRDPARRLKIGYLSPDLRSHSVAYFIEPILANHDKSRIEVFCYYNHGSKDEVTLRLAGLADHWVDCAQTSDDLLSEKIRLDGIDILVDLAGHTAGNRLPVMAHKPAPIQLTYLGYPGSTWLSAVDYRLTDHHADPEVSEAYYSEKLLRLPHSLWCYRPGSDAPDVSPLPAMTNGHVTFGVFCNFNKIDRASIELWANVLHEIAESRLMIVGVPGEKSRRSLIASFESLGIESKRLDVLGRFPLAEFRQKLQQSDIALDPVSISSPTTMCECLWMGVPTISLYGKRCSSRAGLSILAAAGLDEFAAPDSSAYLAIAKDLAKDTDRLRELRGQLRQKLSSSPLLDAEPFTRSLEQTYRDIWAAWCEELSSSC